MYVVLAFLPQHVHGPATSGQSLSSAVIPCSLVQTLSTRVIKAHIKILDNGITLEQKDIQVSLHTGSFHAESGRATRAYLTLLETYSFGTLKLQSSLFVFPSEPSSASAIRKHLQLLKERCIFDDTCPLTLATISPSKRNNLRVPGIVPCNDVALLGLHSLGKTAIKKLRKALRGRRKFGWMFQPNVSIPGFNKVRLSS